MKVILDRLVQTCDACPSQWDGVTEDDRAVYVRYRWGALTVEVGAVGDRSEYAAVNGECIHAVTLGDELDGVLSEEDLKTHLRAHAPDFVVETSEAVTRPAVVTALEELRR